MGQIKNIKLHIVTDIKTFPITNSNTAIMVSMDTSEDVVEQQQEEEGVVHTEHNTTLFYGQRDKGKGTLYITEHHVVWKGCHDNTGNHDNNNVLTLQYPSISLHAISRDTSSFPHQCLYVLLESPLTDRDEAAADEEEEERDPQAEVFEVRFVPEDSNNIKAMYDALAECQELHPDPEDENSDVEEGEEPDFDALLSGGEFYTASNMPDEIELSAEGHAVLQRLNIATVAVDDNNGNGNGFHGNSQFDDADDDMEES